MKGRMRRRELLLLLAGMTIAPISIHPQQKAIPAIGFLGAASPGPYTPYVVAFREGLREAGYVEGKTLRSNTAGPSSAMIGCPHSPNKQGQHTLAKLYD